MAMSPHQNDGDDDMTTKTHTHSDGSKVDLGADKGKGWLSKLKAEDAGTEPKVQKQSSGEFSEYIVNMHFEMFEMHRPPRKRQILGRKAIRVQPETTTRPDREF